MIKQAAKYITLWFVCVIIIIFMSACSHTPYVKVGAGYKIEEPKIYWFDGTKTNNPISARMEAGFKYQNWSYGLSHHSQWLRGWPVNDKFEYYKTEFFIDYEWDF